MRPFFILLTLIAISISSYASTQQDYLKRFSAYSTWSQHLPDAPTDDFLTFIADDTPLAKKLREQWLYHLAKEQDWERYRLYYQPSGDLNLQCFAEYAHYYQNREETPYSFATAKTIWLSSAKHPAICDQLFALLIQDGILDDEQISKRLTLALTNANVLLAKQLLLQFKPPRVQEADLLTQIYQDPKRINKLDHSQLHTQFYLYGLKRLATFNMPLAINYWQHAEREQLLTLEQNQSFIAHVALYKAMRDHQDASRWFSQIMPAYHSQVLLDWQIRLALKRQQWPDVVRLINDTHDSQNPERQYWLARAYDELDQPERAQAIYQTLAQTRQYYGFLASIRLHQSFTFLNETGEIDTTILRDYQPFLNHIALLYHAKQSLSASRLLNDFVLELPKDDKSALAYWLAHDLQWYSKSLSLSNNSELSNQLALRFPLPYPLTIGAYATQYHVLPAFIYALIRQESGFREDVVSTVGARGLMQILPNTASQIAKTKKISYSNKNQLFIAEKNINIGTAYLQDLAHRFHDHPLLMAAAYNAGPKQVTYWLKNHPPKDIDIWIDTLPWHETRNYLKNIISFYLVYQYRTGQKQALTPFLRAF